ncbi:hypothetical protein INR49_031695, partial [Caranx melampygus]
MADNPKKRQRHDSGATRVYGGCSQWMQLRSHPGPNFHILHLMVKEEKSGFKTHVEEEAEDDMVNVNTQVSSNMELPF